jgi:hypothetical protein
MVPAALYPWLLENVSVCGGASVVVNGAPLCVETFPHDDDFASSEIEVYCCDGGAPRGPRLRDVMSTLLLGACPAASEGAVFFHRRYRSFHSSEKKKKKNAVSAAGEELRDSDLAGRAPGCCAGKAWGIRSV